MIREEIKDLIKRSIKGLQKAKKPSTRAKLGAGLVPHRPDIIGTGAGLPKFESPEIQAERPEEKAHGDYATNVAMVIAKQINKNPIEIANLLSLRFKVKGLRYFDKVEVKEPGFINFFLSKEFLQKQVGEILKQGEKFGKLKLGKGGKAHPVKSGKAGVKQFNRVNVEFISANPTGPLHIGHGRGAFFGDTLANILEKAGYKVVREYYVNDAKVNTQIRTLGQTALGKGVTYLNDYLKSKILNLKSKLEKIQNEGEAGYLLAQEVQKDIKDFIEKKLKIKFGNWVSEEELYQKGKIKKIYQWLERKKLLYQKEGAKWLKISQFGATKDGVLIRSSGEPTYFLSDIVYHKDKFERKFKRIINIWGADHQGHVPRMKAVAKMLGFKGDLDILISQIVRLKGGLKLSKRKGQIIALEDLINEIGLDVARFFYLSKSLNTQMEFDVDLAKEQSEKNPVYYIQYAYARIHSILAKSKISPPHQNLVWGQANQKSKIPRIAEQSSLQGRQFKSQNLKLLNHPSELELIKQLIRFPEIIEDTARDYQTQRIPQYALDLARAFHQFYRDCRVLAEARPLSEARLALILATKMVLKETLRLMGISAPEKM